MYFAAEGNAGFFYRADTSYPADGRCTCEVDLVEDEDEDDWDLLEDGFGTTDELLTPGLAVYRVGVAGRPRARR